MFALMTGGPDGFEFIGPFDTVEEATEYADATRNVRNTTWWVVTLQTPG